MLHKRRTVFLVNRETLAPQLSEPTKGYILTVDPPIQAESHTYQTLAASLGAARLDARLKNPDLTLYIATETATGQTAGYYWAATSKTRPLWHDNFPIPKGSALLFNALVLPEHRRRGLYLALISTAQQHLLLTNKLEAVYTIVENSNQPSLKANWQAGGQMHATNHLLKLLRRNIFSIYKFHKTNKLEVHYVFHNAKSHRF